MGSSSSGSGLRSGHESDSKDRFRFKRIQLRDMCFRFLEESITFKFFCTTCVMLLVLCTAGIQKWNFFKKRKEKKKKRKEKKEKKKKKKEKNKEEKQTQSGKTVTRFS